MVVKAEIGQNLVDLSLQHLGGVEGVMDIVKLNPGFSFMTEFNTQVDVLLPDVLINKVVVEYYRVNKIIVINK